MVIVPVRELISVTLFSGCGDMDEEDHRYSIKLFIDHGDGGSGDGWYLVRCFDLTTTGDGMRFYSRIFPILFIRNSQNVFRINWRRCGNEFEWWRRERNFFSFTLFIIYGFVREISESLLLWYSPSRTGFDFFFSWCWTFVSLFYTMYIKSYLGRCLMY